MHNANRYFELLSSVEYSRFISLYHPSFGSLISNRSWSDASRVYRYGFNGKEKDFETSSDNYDFGARIYDGRLGRWLSLDPLMKKFTSYSGYNFALNSVICTFDIEGKDVNIGNLVQMNAGAIQVLSNSSVVSGFINQFASNQTGRGTQIFYTHTSDKSSGTYANNVNLNFNSVQRNSPNGLNMINNNQDATTSITYTLQNGTQIAAALYNPVTDGPVASMSINVDVLQYNPNANNSQGNNEAIAASYTAVAITQELYSTVNLVVQNTNPDGSINFAGLSTALQNAPAAPANNTGGIPQVPMTNLVNSNMDATTTHYVQNTVSSPGNSCLVTYPAGQLITNMAANPAETGTGSTGYTTPLAPTGINPNDVTPTPDNQRNANPTSSQTCY